MSLADQDPVRDLADKIIRESLQHPDNLREFLEQAVPDLAGDFDCRRVRFLDREFPLEDWRRREADLPFEIPYRLGDQEVWALVCVLIEHQSDTDPLMPLRLLFFAVLYWDRQWKEWQSLDAPRPPLRLRPVLPIVLYTGAAPWGSNRTIVDLLGEPEAFHTFAPVWQPLFWNLADLSADALLQTGRRWVQTLAVLRAEPAETAEFEAVLTQVVRYLRDLSGRDHVRWYDLMRIVFTWAVWRRPVQERSRLLAAVQAADPSAERQRDMQNMSHRLGPTLGDLFRAEGKTEEARGLVLRLGRKRLGEPDAATLAALQAVTDLERLEQLIERLMEGANWQELLQGS